MSRKRIVFLTGTRADFGKLKSLISITQNSENYDVHLFVTGMHMNPLYGSTVDEIQKCGFNNIYQFINHNTIENMDRTLAKTVDGFSHYIADVSPDLIVVHGDRVEALAGAIVGSMNNILVAHIEGGEVSGTIDELIRHAVSKMSHIHLVSNMEAKTRLIQLGELESSVFILGSPDLDLMNPETLPLFDFVAKRYEIEFSEYSIAMFHPVTTEYNNVRKNVKYFVDALIKSDENYIVIYPNNDLGSNEILNEYERLKNNSRIKIYPSLRFEYFLTLLNNSKYIVGNSSAGIREAPYYGIPTVDIGTRQNNRAKSSSIFHCKVDDKSILYAISRAKEFKNKGNQQSFFGTGNSDKIFLELLSDKSIWSIQHQKRFQDLKYEQN